MTVGIKDVKKYLKQVYNLDMDINSRLLEKQSIESTLLKVSSVQQDRVQESHAGRYDDKYMPLIRLQSEIDELVDELGQKRVAITRQINQIEDDRYQMVLRLRYLSSKTWEEIALLMNYNLRWIYRLHGEALEEFRDTFGDEIRPL